MAIINGKLIYSEDSYAAELNNALILFGQTIQATRPMPDVSFTLVSTTENKGISLMTNAGGTFTINDIPAGSYALIETAQLGTSYHGTASFNNASSMDTLPDAEDPGISYLTNKGFETHGGNRVASLSRNTIFFTVSASGTITVTDPLNKSDSLAMTGGSYFLFIDAPMKVEPYPYPDGTSANECLIRSLSLGTCGTYMRGTPAGTSDAVCPYEKYTSGNYAENDLNSEFYDNYTAYSATAPDDGSFTILNIANKHSFNNVWFDLASPKKADEVSRFMIVNGSSPGMYFFEETVPVESGKNYLFSCFVCNIVRKSSYELPKFSASAKTLTGEILFSEDISSSFPLPVTALPTWKEIGAIIPADSIGSNTSVVIQFISMGPDALGNDYAIDAIRFCSLENRSLLPKVEKSQLPDTEADENEEIQYTIDLKNDSDSVLKEIILTDPIEFGTSLFSSTAEFTLSDSLGNILVTSYVPISNTILENGISISQIIRGNYNNILNNSLFLYDEETAALLNDGSLPKDYSFSFSYSVTVPDASVLSDECVIRNRAEFTCSMDISELNQNSKQTFYTNETSLSIRCPKLSYQKSAAVIRNDIEIDLEHGGKIFCGELMVYKITVTNQSLSVFSGIDLYDNIDSNLTPVYSLSGDCSNGISTTVISPTAGSEVFLTCDQIESVGGNVNHIHIPDLPVPAAQIVDGVQKDGIVVVRIYCLASCAD